MYGTACMQKYCHSGRDEGALDQCVCTQVPRSIAIDMLLQHDGDVEAAIMEHLADL